MEKITRFNVFIASPSDLQKERQEIKNYINSLQIEEVSFKAMLWEENLHATTINHKENGMQKIIDVELLEPSDIVIGIFRLKFGEKTNGYESATVGEIEESIEKHKPVCLYFWKSEELATELPKEDLESLAKIKEFKEKYENKGIYKEVSNIDESKNYIKEDLKYNVKKIFEKLENTEVVKQNKSTKNTSVKKKNSNSNRNKTKKTNAWYKMSITDFINQYLTKKQIDYIYQDNLTFRENLEISLEYLHYMKSTVEQILNESRVYAFNQKYGQYNYKYDLRSKYENWSHDIIQIIENTFPNRNDLNLLDVGGNSGEELNEMFDKDTGHNLSVLDLSFDAINEGKSKYPYINFYQGNMEKEYPFSSNQEFDVCLCLRAIQSRGVFRTDAIMQMTKALKIGGLIIISIPNGYINRDTNKEEKGLYDHRTHVFSHNAPIELVEKVYKKLNDYNFDNLKYKTIDTEIIIWGIKRKIGE